MNQIAAYSNPPPPTVSFEDVLLPATELHDAPAARYALCLVLQGEARLSYRVDDRWHTQWLHPGMFAPITPPHVEATLQLSGEQRHLMVSIGEEAVARVAAESGTGGRRSRHLAAARIQRPFPGRAVPACLGRNAQGRPARAQLCGLDRGNADLRPAAQRVSDAQAAQVAGTRQTFGSHAGPHTRLLPGPAARAHRCGGPGSTRGPGATPVRQGLQGRIRQVTAKIRDCAAHATCTGVAARHLSDDCRHRVAMRFFRPVALDHNLRPLRGRDTASVSPSDAAAVNASLRRKELAGHHAVRRHRI